MPPDPPRLGVLRTPSLSTFINHHASKGPLLVKKNPPFKIPGYGPELLCYYIIHLLILHHKLTVELILQTLICI